MVSKAPRFWRILVLAWAILLAPQVSILHALSHSLPGSSQPSGDSDKRHHSPAKVCESCLALAQLGAALPASFEWLALEASVPSHNELTPITAVARSQRPYQARAPPAELS